MPFLNDDISINTFIGAGSTVSGNMKISGFTRIDGDVDGNLEISGKVIVGEKSRIKGNIIAKSAIIGGIVEGNITAPDMVQLFSTSVVIGDIATHKLELADNVIFHGHCISLSNQSEYDEAVQQWNDITAIRENSPFSTEGIII